MTYFNLKLTKNVLCFETQTSHNILPAGSGELALWLLTCCLVLSPSNVVTRFLHQQLLPASKDSFPPHPSIPFQISLLNWSLEGPSLNIIWKTPLQIQTKSQGITLLLMFTNRKLEPRKHVSPTNGEYLRGSLSWQSDSSCTRELEVFPKMCLVFRNQERQRSPRGYATV